MALIMEFIIVVVFEVTGLTLNKIPGGEDYSGARQAQYDSQASVRHQKPDHMMLKIAKATIIGRIVMAVIPSKERDLEMEQQ